MDFELTSDQELLRETVRRFLADRAPVAYVRRMLDDPRGTTEEVWRGLAELGLTGILVPAEHGGAGMGMVDVGVVLEEMGRCVHPGPFLSSAVGAVSLVLAAGSPADHAALLPALADGSRVATVALLEAGGRTGLEPPRTTAVAAAGAWTVTGEKRFVPDAAAAEVVLVTARSDDGTGVFAVETAAPGVEVEPVATVDGSRKFATLTLAGAPARRLGTGDAAEALATVADRLAVAFVVDGVGAAARALDMAVEYASHRVQFDRPIGSFQAIGHLCADMLEDLELGRAGAYYALWACDAARPEERHRAATMAKAFASEAFPRLGASLIQVHGGVGFTWEHDAHLVYKRLLTLEHILGSPAQHLEELARIVLD